MANLNNIIEKQVSEQTCIQLRPDVREYVDRIIEFRDLQRKPEHRVKASDYDDYLLEEPTKSKRSIRSSSQGMNTPAEICTSEEVREKFRVLSDLVRKFEKLTEKNRLRAKDLYVYVKNHLGLLDELQSYVRTCRQTHGKAGIATKKNRPASEKYEALVRTAAFIRKNLLLGSGGRQLSNEVNENDYREVNDEVN